MPVAAAWAMALGASLRVVTVVEPATGRLQAAKGNAQAYVDAVATRWFLRHSPVPVLMVPASP